jgi:hypothetical protein
MKYSFNFCMLLFFSLPLLAQNVKDKPDSVSNTSKQPMLEVKKDSVVVNGTLKLSSLGATGKRQVWADENGVLGTGTGYGIESVTNYYNVGPASFVKTNPSSTYLLYNQVWRTYLTTGASESIAAPVNLPQGAMVTSIRVIFLDNTDKDLRIQFLMTKININGSFILSEFTTSSNMTGERSITSNPLAYPVDNQNEYYTVSISPVAGSTWMGSSLYIKAIVFTYEI